MAGRSGPVEGDIWRGHLAGMPDTPASHVVLNPRASRKALGWFFIVLGVLGCVLPFLQGFLFLALGVLVLRDQYVWAADRWAWLAGRWPGAVGKVESLERAVTVRVEGWGAGLRRRLGLGQSPP